MPVLVKRRRNMDRLLEPDRAEAEIPGLHMRSLVHPADRLEQRAAKEKVAYGNGYAVLMDERVSDRIRLRNTAQKRLPAQHLWLA